MPRTPLPADLAGEAFRVSDALSRGVSASRLRGRDLERPFRGVRAAGERGTIAGYTPLLRPGDRFSHTTAADVWPLPLPRHAERLHVTATAPHNAPRRAGVVGHAGGRDRSTLRRGIPVSDPVTLFIELASVIPENDLVAIGDALVLDPAVLDPADPRPWVSLEILRAGCAASRSPGARIARRAVKHVRQGAESRPETLLRLLLVAAGLPEPELNRPVLDERGRLIGRFDLVYRAAKVIVEYDGDQHRTSREQDEHDMTRIDRALEAGWAVVRVRTRGLFVTPQLTVERVRRALTR